MTLMYTFSRRAGLVRRIMRVEGLRGVLPVWSCSLHGAAANPVLTPTRCCSLHGAAICVARPGAGGPSTGM